MKRNIVPLSIATLAIGMLPLVAFPAHAAKPGKGTTRYLIQYHKGNVHALKDVIAANGGHVAFDYSSLIDGLAADLSEPALKAVRRSHLATKIEEDGVRTLHGLPDGFPIDFEEFVGWGVDRVEGDVVWSTGPNTGQADNDVAAPDVRSGAVTGEGIVVGVLDTGIDYGHPDLQDNILDLRADGVIRDFLDGDADPTDSTNNGHGTSTSSTIASVDNDVGVIGVAPGAKISPYRVCDETCPTSAIIGGLAQAVADGVDVINMSFGGSAGFNIEASAIQAANRAGVVLVASAGNDASQKAHFPAAYGTVLAVGATDIDDNPADFTNVGGWVDVTGPGVDVPTATCRGCGREAFLSEVSPTSRAFDPIAMTGSAVATLSDVEVVDVGRACLIDDLLADPTGKVALIVRGDCSFAEKVQHAEDAGAIGTIVYNNEPGNFAGTLGEYEASGPSVSISDTEGQTLASDIAAGETRIDLSVVATDYWLISGTSFSSPHVAGIAALVKSVNPGLSPSEVRNIIKTTAEPIGPQVIFGAGVARADAAVEAAR